jgi:hypothetical protein
MYKQGVIPHAAEYRTPYKQCGRDPYPWYPWARWLNGLCGECCHTKNDEKRQHRALPGLKCQKGRKRVKPAK